VKVRGILTIILINSIVFFAMITLHEFGHVIAGAFSGCTGSTAVLIDANFVGPYTQMECPTTSTMSVEMSGFFITALFSLSFLLLNYPTKNLFFVGMGLSIVFSSLDLSMIISSTYAIYSAVSAGFFFIIFGEYRIASAYANSKFNLNFFETDEDWI